LGQYPIPIRVSAQPQIFKPILSGVLYSAQATGGHSLFENPQNFFFIGNPLFSRVETKTKRGKIQS
jgi:hypothetical protein